MIIRPNWLHARSPSIKPLINDNQSLLLRSVINLKSIYWLFIIVIWFEILPEWSTPSDVPHVLNFTCTHRCYPWHAWAAWGKDGEEETHGPGQVRAHPMRCMGFQFIRGGTEFLHRVLGKTREERNPYFPGEWWSLGYPIPWTQKGWVPEILILISFVFPLRPG